VRRSLLVALLCASGLLATGCIGPGKWRALSPRPIDRPIVLRELSVSAKGSGLPSLLQPPSIPVRKKVRWCCAFGTGLRVRIGKMTLPWIRVGHVLDVDEVGPHRYDGGTAAIDDPRKHAFPKGENNGLLYTCRGGFIDTAHVRDTVDWAAFFVSEIDRSLEEGAEVALPEDGGQRKMILRPVAPEKIAPGSRGALVVAMAQWMAHQVMAWHEFAQWYGARTLEFYPETVSSFSPEDVYSNAVGLHLLDNLNLYRDLASEKIYDRQVDREIAHALRGLGAVPKILSAEAIHAIDKIWWDSDERLPDKALVRRRHLNVSSEIDPWLLPERYQSAALHARLVDACGATPKPKMMEIPHEFDGLRFEDYLTLEITANEELAKQPAFRALGRPVTQRDFEHLLDDIRAENRVEFGQRADRPD